ncbi:MAG: hypothetical protein H6622_11055 [Halobacteriovoraceae bacterium]|nr:hypothetical protein [Halobacteriovoraceae bacterium]
MSLTLLIGDDDKTLDLYSLNLEMYVGCEVLRKKNFQEAIDLLKVLPKLDLIITQKQTDSRETINILETYLLQNKKETPIIIIGEKFQTQIKATFIPQTKEVKPLIKTAATILGVSAQTMVQQIVPDFYPISINYFTCLEKSFCKIFEKVGDDYNILFDIGMLIKHEDVKNRIDLGIENFYVSKDYRLKFVSEVTSAIVEQLGNKNLDTGLRIRSNEATVNLIRDKVGLELEGFNQETVELANAAIESLGTVVDQAPSLKTLLSALINNQSSYLYKHSQLTTFLCFHALDNMEWGTKEQKNKMAFISFFHDIALTRDEFAKIHNEDELSKSHFSKEDKERISKHALLAAKIVKDYPRAPIGADTIIKQHHGSRNGIGFAKYYGDNISPLAIVFIVAEALCDKILENENQDANISSIIEKLHYRFTSEKYSNVLRALDTLKMN